MAIGIEMKGALTLGLQQSDTFRYHALIAIPGILLDVCLPSATTSVLAGSYFAGTIVASAGLQFALLLVWFAPVYTLKPFGGIAMMIKSLFMIHSLNCFDLYFLSVVLSGAEIDKFTKWLVAIPKT